MEKTTADRFWAKVNKGDGCWIWCGHVQKNGYGNAAWPRADGGPSICAHRAAYILTYGAIPDGRVIDHLCRNRRCVRPEHLEAVTQSENLRRGYAARTPPATCRNGHERNARNTGPHGRCRVCDRSRVRDRREYMRIYMRRRRAEARNG